jgi:hypothetical protein
VKLPIKKLLVLKKKGQNKTKKSQSCVKIVKLPIKKMLVFFFARQGLSGPYQIRSSSSTDMDLIILVLRKKMLIINISIFHIPWYQYVLSLWFLSHNLYSSHTLLESLSQLQNFTFWRPRFWRKNYSNREYVVPGLWSSLHKFYGRHHELIDRYGMSCVPNDNGPLQEHLLSPQFF